jgi:hypothetical protein
MFHLANATGVEVLIRDVKKGVQGQSLANNSPNPLSHEIQRISALRHRLRSTSR